MSKFYGTADDDELSYPDALCEIASRIAWPTEEHGREVVKAIQVEHGTYVEPEIPTDQSAVGFKDPRDLELDRLRAELKAAKSEAKASKSAPAKKAAEPAAADAK